MALGHTLLFLLAAMDIWDFARSSPTKVHYDYICSRVSSELVAVCVPRGPWHKRASSEMPMRYEPTQQAQRNSSSCDHELQRLPYHREICDQAEMICCVLSVNQSGHRYEHVVSDDEEPVSSSRFIFVVLGVLTSVMTMSCALYLIARTWYRLHQRARRRTMRTRTCTYILHVHSCTFTQHARAPISCMCTRAPSLSTHARTMQHAYALAGEHVQGHKDACARARARTHARARTCTQTTVARKRGY